MYIHKKNKWGKGEVGWGVITSGNYCQIMKIIASFDSVCYWLTDLKTYNNFLISSHKLALGFKSYKSWLLILIES